MGNDPVRKIYLANQVKAENKLKSYRLPRQNFRASELGKCKRCTYYRLAGYIPTAFGARGMDYSRDGDLHHDAVRFWLKENGVRLDKLKFMANGTVKELEEYVLDLEYNGEKFRLSMRLDGRIRIGAFWHILEIKSLGSGKLRGPRQVWQRVLTSEAVLAELASTSDGRGYIFQVHAGMYASKIPRAYLLIKDRDYCANGLHSYRNDKDILGGPIIKFQQSVWDQVLSRMATIARALRTEIPPQPEFLSSSKECGYCSYRHLCYGADQRRKLNIQPAMLHPTLGDKIHVDDLNRRTK